MSADAGRAMPRVLAANRNLIVFAAMLLLVVMLPLFDESPLGEWLLAAVTITLVIVATAMNGRSRRLFWLSLLLAVPAVVLRLCAFLPGSAGLLVWSWACTAAVLVVTMLRLLIDIFGAGPVSRDRLFGCATVYLMIGVLWCFLYTIIEELAPGSISGLSASRTVRVADLAYFSLNIATNVALTTGMPVSRPAQVLVLLQEYTSVLYMAFVISRLVGLRTSAGSGPDADSA